MDDLLATLTFIYVFDSSVSFLSLFDANFSPFFLLLQCPPTLVALFTLESFIGCLLHKGDPSAEQCNLDERVSDRVLYDILIQAGRVVDLHIPRDRETDRPKGFAFAEYETKEIADYAVKLFSGLVTLYNRTLRFGISGQDKSAPNTQASTLASNSPFKSRLNVEVSPSSLSQYTQVSPGAVQLSNVNRSQMDHNNYDHRRGHGATWDGTNLSTSNRYDTSNPKHHDRY
ncbi:serine/arginine-rich splicing factor SC35-like [Cynara cardunculus var. scolymus]|uniref:serine/arginine-rich splicing factor SC35-like n=1 Tax=Cynara cardunculus var. scolymus TaxID=59895 RepID=UPI000D627083|nr:serine/arginine-rich splicing factor SC35-like [Cynara cardunculus var. scolymus]